MAQTFKYGNGIWANKQGSSLAYNDENGSYKPLPFNFERSSSATRTNKEGLIEAVNTDVPRIDYKDNTKGALLLEPQSTNYVVYSEDFSQSYWSKSNSTITSNTGISPDGSQNASNLYFNGASNASLRTVMTSTSGQVYTFSIWIKKISANYTNNINARIEGFASGTVGVVFLGDTLNAAPVGEFVRYSVTTSASTGGTSHFQFRSDEDATFEVWGAQIENKSYVTSYTPTFGAASTRSAYIEGSTVDLSSVVNSQEGTFIVDFSILADNDGNKYITLGDGGTFTNNIIIGYVSAGLSIQIYKGGTQVSSYFSAESGLDFKKIAVSWKQNEVKFYKNGELLDTDLSFSTFDSDILNKLYFNISGRVFYGETRSIKLYNTALTDQELQALTRG
jgi:hypothetical protein